MREQIPNFYVRFTNQQLDLFECYQEPGEEMSLSYRYVPDTYEERTTRLLNDTLSGYNPRLKDLTK